MNLMRSVDLKYSNNAFACGPHACIPPVFGQSLPLTSVDVLWTRVTNGKLPVVKRKSQTGFDVTDTQPFF